MIYIFDEFELDVAQMELRHHGRAQLVPPRVLKLMLHLIRERARAVSRDELSQVVWGGLSVSDAALSQAIMLARKITQDEGEKQRVIKTVRGHGFRFVASVTEREQAAPAAPPPTPLGLTAVTSLVGRDRELALLAARLARAEQGQGSLILLEGEPGIGKTSLAEQFCKQASARKAQVFWGRCWEEGGAPAFWPFIQVLRALFARFGSAALRAWLGNDCGELVALAPELAEKPLARPTMNPLSLGSTHARFRILDDMARLLARVAHSLHRDAANTSATEGRAVVLSLDDLHAADDESLQLIRFLTADLRELPLLVLGTFRDLEVTRRGALSALLGGPLENTQRMTLSRLAARDVAELVRRLTGHAVATQTSELLYELSGGNPFLVSELARCPEHELERSALSMLRMPERMTRAVHRRIEGLAPATRTLLEVAAVVGREFSLATLGTLLERAGQALLNDLDPALRNGVIEPVPGSAGAALRFSHALVRDTLYGELPLARRVSLHLQVAEALEASEPTNPLPLHELAHHFYLAVPAGVGAKAIDYALRAATHAEQILAFDNAANLRDRAIELSSAPEVEGRRYELLVGAGAAWYRAGELDKASARFSRAAEHAEARGDGLRLALAVLSYARVRRGFVVYDPRFSRLVGAALAALGPSDGVLKAMLIGYRSLAPDSYGSMAARDEATLEALEMARRLEHDQALMVALAIRRWLMTGALHPTETRRIATELIELARRVGRNESLMEGLFWRIQDHLELGDVALANEDLREYHALAERKRHTTHRYWSLLFRAMQCTWSGKFSEAFETAESARKLGERIREPMTSVLHAVQLWNIHTLQGTIDEAPELLELSVPGADSFAARALWLQIRATQERYDEARRLYDELAKHDFADVASDPLRRNVIACLAAGCAALDDHARAPKLYDLLLPDAELNVVATSSWAFAGPVSRYLARLALCMRDNERAVLHYERALEQLAAFGAWPLHARIQYECAHALRLLPDARNEQASQLLAASQTAARELGIASEWPLPPTLRARPFKS